MSICKECPYFLPMARCALCGCFMKVKARLRRSQCPDKQWGREKKETKE